MAHQCHYHIFSLLSAKYPLYVIILKEKWPTRHYRMIQWRWLAHNPLQWRHNERDVVSNHQPHDCLLNCLFRRRSKKTSKFRVTGLCAGIHRSPVNPPHKWPVTRKMFPFDDVIMQYGRSTNDLAIEIRLWVTTATLLHHCELKINGQIKRLCINVSISYLKPGTAYSRWKQHHVSRFES